MMEADVIRQVIEYLSKKGYSRTESMLRIESANQEVDGRPMNIRAEETGGAKYGKAFGELNVSFISSMFLKCGRRINETMD